MVDNGQQWLRMINSGEQWVLMDVNGLLQVVTNVYSNRRGTPSIYKVESGNSDLGVITISKNTYGPNDLGCHPFGKHQFFLPQVFRKWNCVWKVTSWSKTVGVSCVQWGVNNRISHKQNLGLYDAHVYS